jgi:hypothetical protein
MDPLARVRAARGSLTVPTPAVRDALYALAEQCLLTIPITGECPTCWITNGVHEPYCPLARLDVLLKEADGG